MNSVKPREGDVHETICVGGHEFTIRYGYYTDHERDTVDPIPIYPCFLSDPRYTPEGYPLVTRIQDACEHYVSDTGGEGDGWCADCIHLLSKHNEIAVCKCEQRRIQELPKAAEA